MSIFSAILGKLGLGKEAHTAPMPAPAAPAAAPHPPLPTAAPPKPAEMAPMPAPPVAPPTAAPTFPPSTAAPTFPPPTAAPPFPPPTAAPPFPPPSAAPTFPPPSAAPTFPPPSAAPPKPAEMAPTLAPAAPPKPAEMVHVAAVPVVDVVAKLEAMAASRPEKLNWKVSIADLLFLLGMDNSLKARKELAQELGCPANLMGGDSSQMNIWLHKTVLSKIAENGGNIPKELLD